MITLSGLRLNEIEKLMEDLGATKFRAKQIHNWIYSKSVSTIDEMTNLSKDFREELKQKAIVTTSKIKVKQVLLPEIRAVDLKRKIVRKVKKQ